MRRLILATLLAGAALAPAKAGAFCGCMMAPPETTAERPVAAAELKNHASRVVIARADGRTVLTMANDYEGPLDRFALIIPVPTPIEQGQVHVTDMALIDRLTAFTAPRLTRVRDLDPCAATAQSMVMTPSFGGGGGGHARETETGKSFGVTVENSFTAGEYDIQILSATQSGGLMGWLAAQGYGLPPGAEPVFGAYLKQGMRFFLARVNLDRAAAGGRTWLRPLQVAYESERFTLPIRLGTLNADGPQELMLITLTRQGRVDSTNYRAVRLPTGGDLPLFVGDDFGGFYRDLFAHETEKENRRAVFLEYAGRADWCATCIAPVPREADLRELGRFWSGAPFITRLHMTYDAAHFPEDLALQETGDRSSFEVAFRLRQPHEGSHACAAGRTYAARLPARFEAEAQLLARLTGQDINAIRARMTRAGQSADPDDWVQRKWWQKLWPRDGEDDERPLEPGNQLLTPY